MQSPDISWCVPDVSGNEAVYAAHAVASGQVGPSGEFLTRFESQIAQITGARHAVSTSSGTAALHLTVLLAGVRPSQAVIVPAWTFAYASR